MSNKDCHTEEQIKQKVKTLFFTKGVFNASTQEVADFAGVNRTLVNYYFRSKHKLFQIVYTEIIQEMRNKYASIYVSEKAFREKVEELLDFTAEFKGKYPYLEIFNIQKYNKYTEGMQEKIFPQPMEEAQCFLEEIKEEMEKGIIPTYEPINFLMNIFSLITFPMMMKPIYKSIFNITSEEQYQKIYKQRKAMAMTILFNNEK